MAALGCPLVGDKLYGVGDEVFFQNLRGALSEQVRAHLVLERHALHAHRLVFFHPMRQQELTLEAPLPADMTALLDGAS